jgi:hypothetical protein
MLPNVPAVGAPRNTPVEIIDKLNKEVNAGLADHRIKARIADGAIQFLQVRRLISQVCHQCPALNRRNSYRERPSRRIARATGSIAASVSPRRWCGTMSKRGSLGVLTDDRFPSRLYGCRQQPRRTGRSQSERVVADRTEQRSHDKIGISCFGGRIEYPPRRGRHSGWPKPVGKTKRRK